jgi:hypothetical protein
LLLILFFEGSKRVQEWKATDGSKVTVWLHSLRNGKFEVTEAREKDSQRGWRGSLPVFNELFTDSS